MISIKYTGIFGNSFLITFLRHKFLFRCLLYLCLWLFFRTDHRVYFRLFRRAFCLFHIVKTDLHTAVKSFSHHSLKVFLNLSTEFVTQKIIIASDPYLIPLNFHRMAAEFHILNFIFFTEFLLHGFPVLLYDLCRLQGFRIRIRNLQMRIYTDGTKNLSVELVLHIF